MAKNKLMPRKSKWEKSRTCDLHIKQIKMGKKKKNHWRIQGKTWFDVKATIKKKMNRNMQASDNTDTLKIRNCCRFKGL